MKRLILFSILLASPLIAASVKTVPQSKYDATVQWYEDKLTAIDVLVGQLKVSVDSADAKASAAQDELKTTKSDLDQTYIHLADVEKKFDKAKSDLAEQKIKTEKYKREAHVKSTIIDFVLAVLSAALTIIVLMCGGQIIGWIVKIFPAAAPFGALIEVGLLFGTFGLSFGILKGVLAVIESKL